MHLNNASYQQIQELNYDRNNANNIILHLGLGAFYKAHFCVYLDEYNNTNEPWLIEAISLKSNTSKRLMRKQDNLYTVLEKSQDNQKIKLIQAVKNTSFLEEDRDYINGLFVKSTTKMITLTITEKGYCFSPSLSGLDLMNKDIVHDLKNLKKSKSAIALLVYGLSLRKQVSDEGLTLLSCDNLPSNGKILKKVVLDFASLIDVNLKNWIENNCTFPSSMVDRIVPKITSIASSQIKKLINLEDEAGLVCEDFRQFVIEDDFVNNDKPCLEKVGALFVDEIDDYEYMKLRILNGTHSALAYLGQLLNKESIFNAINDVKLELFIEKMIKEEIIPSLKKVDGIDLIDYAQVIIKRYKNSNIEHKTIQICMDGSQKLPQRWLETLKYLLEHNKTYDCFAFALASWIKFTSGIDLEEKTVLVNDPLSSTFVNIWKEEKSSYDIVKAYFSISDIFEDFYKEEEYLITKVSEILENIHNLEFSLGRLVYSSD